MNHDHLKAQYSLDEDVHPTGKAWEWWEASWPNGTWKSLVDPPLWYEARLYRRKADAPLVYNDHGVTRCIYGDKPQAAINACKDILEINDQPKWTERLTDNEDQAALLEDLVHHPYHYSGQGGIECIEVLEQLSANGHDFRILNAMKYLWRYRHKGGTQSLEKAIWYIERVIGDME